MEPAMVEAVNDGPKLFIDKKGKKNTLKAEGNAAVIQPVAEEEEDGSYELTLVEKEELDLEEEEEEALEAYEEAEIEEEVEEVAEEEEEEATSQPINLGLPKAIPPVVKRPTEDLTLEIKPSAEEEDPEALAVTSGKPIEQLDAYDPVLDLRDYKYPSLDLLEVHGSEKIVQDASRIGSQQGIRSSIPLRITISPFSVSALPLARL